MKQAGEFVAASGQVIPQPGDLLFELNIADVAFRLAHELGNALPPLFVADHVDHFRADFFQRLADVAGDALLVGDAEDQERFAGKAKEVVHRRTSVSLVPLSESVNSMSKRDACSTWPLAWPALPQN